MSRGIFLQIEMFLVDRKGRRKLVLRKKQDPFVKAMTYVIYAMFTSVNQNVTDITNTARSYGHTEMTGDPGATLAYGIVVGSGTDAVTISDYKLQTMISHGSGSGQLYYAASTFNAPVLSGSTYSSECYRPFINLSGADVAVNEVGIMPIWGSYYFLLARDTTGGITVPADGMLIVIYKIQTTI